MEEKLIESVRSRKVLYDTNHPDYMRNKLKKQLWEEVSKEVKMSNGKFNIAFIYNFIDNEKYVSYALIINRWSTEIDKFCNTLV